MSSMVILSDGLAVAGRSSADNPCHERFGKDTLNLVRYADPAAWVVAMALAEAADEASGVGSEMGVITIGEYGPVEAMSHVARTAAEGFVSPLRFVAAGPGTLAGVACIALGFCGPTLNMSGRPTEVVPVALILAERWLVRRVVRFVGLVVCTHPTPDRPIARCLMLASRGAGTVSTGSPATIEDADWLLMAPKGPGSRI
jgi:hypothetical protein